jgi:transposase
MQIIIQGGHKMTNYKEILRLYCGGYSQRAIATSLRCSRDAVSLCINRAKERNLKLPVTENITNEELNQFLYNSREGIRNPGFLLPNFKKIAEELKKPHMTNGLVWTEYLIQCKSTGLEPYSVSQFNALLRDYSQRMNISLRQDHKPGEVLELDWSGSAILLSNRLTDDTIPCHLFVAAFPFSGYFYAEAFTDEKVLSWVTGLVNALTFFGGVSLILRPDNLKAAIIKPDKYEPVLNVAMIELAEHYRTAVIPARVRTPRDKNVVEGMVGYASRQIIATVRNQKFFSLEEMNTVVWDLTDKLNATDFKKKDGSRELLFKEIEQKELLPLPPKPFQLFGRATATVAPDYHIEYDAGFYSVSPKLIKSEVSVKASSVKVSIYHKGNLHAEHPRCRFKGQRSTLPEHVHDKHADYLLWSGDYFLSQAKAIGAATEQIIRKVLASRDYEVQSYRSCVGILRLAKRHGSPCLEEACREALSSGLYSYKSINTIAKTLKDAFVASVGGLEEAVGDESSLNELYCVHDGGEGK